MKYNTKLKHPEDHTHDIIMETDNGCLLKLEAKIDGNNIHFLRDTNGVNAWHCNNININDPNVKKLIKRIQIGTTIPMENQLEKLKNQYPLNTFKGETHKELVNLIGKVIFNEREIVRKSIVEKIGNLERLQEYAPDDKENRGYNQAISEIISIINKI